MLVKIFSKKIFILIFFFLFLLTSVGKTENKYFKCDEIITNIRVGDDFKYKKGEKIGTNFVKFEDYGSNSKITIHFRYNDSKEKPSEILKNRKIIKSPIGFEVNYSWSTETANTNIKYNFVKLDKEYAFTRSEFWWSAKDNNNKQQKYDYDSNGRCKNISMQNYNNLFKKVTIAKKEKINKIIKKEKKNSSKSKKISGKRAFALSWEKYDELIAGTLEFSETNLIGNLKFVLPNDNVNCSGTYALSKNKGTWSILCENDMNASGTLKLKGKNNRIIGNGKDSKGKKVKFSVEGKS